MSAQPDWSVHYAVEFGPDPREVVPGDDGADGVGVEAIERILVCESEITRRRSGSQLECPTSDGDDETTAGLQSTERERHEPFGGPEWPGTDCDPGGLFVAVEVDTRHWPQCSAVTGMSRGGKQPLQLVVRWHICNVDIEARAVKHNSGKGSGSAGDRQIGMDGAGTTVLRGLAGRHLGWASRVAVTRSGPHLHLGGTSVRGG
jgi:hypothetical protein